MRVAVLRDYSYAERPGEEELLAERLLRVAPDTVELEVLPPTVSFGKEELDRADVFISFGLKRYDTEVLEYLKGTAKAHVMVVQDYWDGTQPLTEYRDDLVQRAARVFLMSPLHVQRWEHLYGDDGVDNKYILPFLLVPEDLNDDTDIHPEPQEAAMWVAPWHPDHGSDLLIRWSDREHREVHAYGLGVPSGGTISKYVSGKGMIELDKMLGTMDPYASLVYFPRVPPPFGLPVLLAYMQRKEVTYNNEIGCLSYGDLENLVSQCLEVPDYFWRHVDAAVC